MSRLRTRGAAGAIGAFQYGYPTGVLGGASVAQWIFEESSGDIVDTVGAITLSPSAACLYRQDCSGYSEHMAYGIHTDAGRQFNGVASAAMDLAGTEDAAFEFVVKWPAAPSSGGNTESFFLHTQSGAAAAGYYFLYQYAADGNYGAYFYTDDATAVTASWVDPFSGANPTTTGAWIKFRFVVDRTAHTVEMFANGISKGPKSIATIAGKDITTTDLTIGGRYDAFRPGDVLFNEVRACIGVGVKNQNSGGPGGG